jgi:hypothetical protein
MERRQLVGIPGVAAASFASMATNLSAIGCVLSLASTMPPDIRVWMT